MTDFNHKILVRAVGFCLVLVLVLSLCNYTMFDDNNQRRFMMHEMYTYESSIDLAFLGASVAYIHFDPEIWNQTMGLNTFNLGSDCQTPDATYFLMKELFKYHSPKYCVYAMTYISFLDDPMYDNPTKDHILFDYFEPSFNKMAYWLHAFKDEEALEAVLSFLREKEQLSFSTISNVIKLKRSWEYQTYDYSLHGGDWMQYKGDGFVAINDGKLKGNVGEISPPDFSEMKIDPMKVSYFQKLVDLCKKNNCELIMIATPIPYAAAAVHEDYQQICDFYSELARTNDIKLYDFSLSRPELFYPEDVDFYDHVHMNGTAAERFSVAASNVVKQYILGEPIDESKLFYGSYQELLDASPYIFNTWLESTGGGYLAKSTYGTGVIPEYRFSVRDSSEDSWRCIQEYGKQDFLIAEKIPKGTVQIKIEVRPEGFLGEYQQYDILYI